MRLITTVRFWRKLQAISKTFSPDLMEIASTATTRKMENADSVKLTHWMTGSLKNAMG
jgi:hypothetical protein